MSYWCTKSIHKSVITSILLIIIISFIHCRGGIVENFDSDKIEDTVSEEEDNISVEEIRPTEITDNSAEELVVDILENIQTNTQEPESLDSKEPEEVELVEKIEKPDFSKMNLGALKTYIIEQGWVEDASKMKKAQILSLIQEHQ